MSNDFIAVAHQQGWTEATQIELLLQYIEKQGSRDVFEDYLTERTSQRPKIYKTVIKLTVLSDCCGVGLCDPTWIMREITEGDSSIGTVETELLNAVLPEQDVHEELLKMGNDGTFFE